jgi:hypothetical protein
MWYICVDKLTLMLPLNSTKGQLSFMCFQHYWLWVQKQALFELFVHWQWWIFIDPVYIVSWFLVTSSMNLWSSRLWKRGTLTCTYWMKAIIWTLAILCFCVFKDYYFIVSKFLKVIYEFKNYVTSFRLYYLYIKYTQIHTYDFYKSFCFKPFLPFSILIL